MSDVKRYYPDTKGFYSNIPFMDLDSHGDYVRYEDYERLERENADLRKQLEQAEHDRDNWRQIVKDQNDAESEARKCASKYDQSDSFGVESLATIIERIIGQLEQAETRINWQPMETAPRGGGADMVTDPGWVKPPRILLKFKDEVVSVAYWDFYYAEGGAGYVDGFAWIEPCSGEPLHWHYGEPTGWAALSPTEQKEPSER